MPETIINEVGQEVKVFQWEEFLETLRQRKDYTGKEDLNGKTLVVKHTWGLGDVLYSTPALKALKEKFPDCKIAYITTNPEILRNNPAVAEVIDWLDCQDILDVIERFKGQDWYFLNYDCPLKGGYDYKVNLRTKPQLNEYVASLLLKKKDDLTGQQREFVKQASNYAIERYQMVALDMYCWHAFVNPPEKSIYYYPTEQELQWAEDFLLSVRVVGKKPIILIPKTSSRCKDYPHWEKVIQLSGEDCYWLILGARGSAEGWGSPRVSDCSGAFSLRQSAALCIQADLVCSSDTGLTYIRAAQGKNCLMVYGPHEPQPFLHYFPTAHGLRIDRLRTTPGMEGMCSVGCYIDMQSCHKEGDYPPCLKELEPEVVVSKMKELLESSNEKSQKESTT